MRILTRVPLSKVCACDTYGGLSDETLSQAVEIVEKLLDADLSLEDLGLHALFNVELNVDNAGGLGDAEAVQVLRSTLSDLYGSSWLASG